MKFSGNAIYEAQSTIPTAIRYSREIADAD